MANRYLQDKAMRRMRRMDGRNPYGAKGGYVMPSKRDRNMAMDYGNYHPEHYSGNHNTMDYNYGNPDYHYGYEHYGQHNRPMEMYGYAVGTMRPYDMNYDMRYDMGMDYAYEEKDYHKKLHEWTEKLKHKDRFHKEKPEIIQMARSMGAEFNNYSEDEFVAIYYMTVSDIRNELIPSPQQAVLYAIDWIEDDDVKMKGSDKVCSYLYATVLGEDD